MAEEIASAYVSLLVKAPGVKKDIENVIDSVDSEGAGGKIADGVGSGITNKQAAIAGAFGGVFALIANSAATGIGNMIGDAIAQSDATDKFASTLDFAGLDTSAVESAMAASQEYADRTVYDLSTIQNTTAQLAANGIQNYSELTEAAGNLNAIAGGNADTFNSVAQMMSQTAGAGKLTTENWNQLADAIPGASGRLQEAMKDAGAYTGDFRDAMAQGEITADEFNEALLALGTEPVAVEAASSVSTMEGAAGNAAAAITGRLAEAFDIIKPLVTGVTSAFGDFIANSDIFIPVISGLGAALLVALAPAIWAAVTATWAFTTALLANPVTWIIVGIAALVAGIVALAMNWDTVVAWISEVWGGFIGWITGVIDGFVGWWNGIWSGLGQWFSDTWNNIVLVATVAVGILSDAIGGVLSTIAETWENIWQGMVDFIGTVFNGALDIIKAPINGLIDLINGMIDGLNGISVDIPDWVPIFGGQTFGLDLPSIPRLAEGGIVSGSSSGTLALIGEAGRGRDEAVIPLPSDWKTNGIGGGGVKVEQHFAHLDPHEASRIAANDLAFALR